MHSAHLAGRLKLMEAQRLRSRLAFWYSRATVVLASALLAQLYTIELPPYIDLRKFALGQERMPFQARELMRWPLLWAENSSFLQHHTAGRTGLNSPERVVMLLISFAAILLSVWAARKIEKIYWPNARVPLLSFAVLVVLFLFDFLISVPFSFPYDLPAMMFLGWGLYFVLTDQFLWLLPLFILATWNRETSLFLILARAAIALARQGRWRLRSLRQKDVLELVILTIAWIMITGYLHHKYSGDPSEEGPRVLHNLSELVRPVLWPAILSASAYLLPWIFWKRELISSPQLRSCVLILPLWVLLLLSAGQILEVRIYGDISVFIAVCAAAILRVDLSGDNRDSTNRPLKESRAAA
jgi:hypothetical protein